MLHTFGLEEQILLGSSRLIFETNQPASDSARPGFITLLLRRSDIVLVMHRPIDPTRYHAYLLRLWQTGEGEAAVWRVLLEDPRTGERHGFADLDSLFVFLTETCQEIKHND